MKKTIALMMAIILTLGATAFLAASAVLAHERAAVVTGLDSDADYINTAGNQWVTLTITGTDFIGADIGVFLEYVFENENPYQEGEDGYIPATILSSTTAEVSFYVPTIREQGLLTITVIVDDEPTCFTLDYELTPR